MKDEDVRIVETVVYQSLGSFGMNTYLQLVFYQYIFVDFPSTTIQQIGKTNGIFLAHIPSKNLTNFSIFLGKKKSISVRATPCNKLKRK